MAIKLREYLDRNLLTQTEFARRSGLSRENLWKIFSGRVKSKVTRITAVKVEQATDGKIKISDFGY